MKIIGIAILCLILFACKNQPKQENTEANKTKQTNEIKVVNKGNVSYSEYFTDKTMRVDYYHNGTATEEHFGIQQIVNDGNWPGSKTKLIDKLELGLYFFEVIDTTSKVLLYSRGFASIFGEWQTIPEAKTEWGTFHESIRFPWPLKPVTVILKKRDAQNKFQTIWSTTIDPASRIVNSAELPKTYKINDILVNGNANDKLDIVILGDGYSKTEMAKFLADSKRLSGFLMNAEPFKSLNKNINIRCIETPGETSGVFKPHPGVFNRTPLSVQYGAFDSERYALGFDNKTIRDVASAVPYDFMVILVNERTYGGGGIYNLYTTVSADNKFAEYIMVHEMGHHMAALADEYYASAVSYEIPAVTVEPWETNITALFNKNSLKWRHLVDKSTPIPTPWNKEPFDKFGLDIQAERVKLRAEKVEESVMENLFLRQMKTEDEFFAKEKYKDQVGAFEGAGYLAKGLYRSQADCIMFTRHVVFCKVCQNSLSDVIKEYSE